MELEKEYKILSEVPAQRTQFLVIIIIILMLLFN